MNEAAALITACALLLGAVVAWRKFGPERNDITVTSAVKVQGMSLSFADKVDEDNTGLREDVRALKAEFAQYRADTEARLSELAVELRAERAEKVAVKAQNTELRGRVADLEREVASLKANGN